MHVKEKEDGVGVGGDATVTLKEKCCPGIGERTDTTWGQDCIH